MDSNRSLRAVFTDPAQHRSNLAALAVNAVNGAFLMLVLLLPLGPWVSTPLMLLMAALFGPCFGLIVATVYARIEFRVGQRVGGEASFEALYRIFAWSFFPVGMVAALSWLILVIGDQLSRKYPALVTPVTSVTSAIFTAGVVVVLFSIKNYCSNVLSSLHTSKGRGLAGMLATLVLFVLIPAWLIVLLPDLKLILRRSPAADGSDDKMKARAGIPVKRVAIAIALFYLALFSWLVLYDEKPDPVVVKELSARAPDVLRVDNAWLAFLGFTLPTGGRPPFAKEEETLRNVRLALKSNKSGELENPSVGANQRRLSFRGNVPEMYLHKDDGIWDYVSNHYREVEDLIGKNDELLQRYQEFYGYRHYQEPLDCGLMAPVPEFSTIRKVQKIRLMQLARKAQLGNVDAALTGVRKDGEFWRFVAKESDSLLSRLISISILSSDFKFVGELCAHHRMGPREEEKIREILRPFDRQEASLTRPFRSEARVWIQGIEYALQADATFRRWKYPLVKKSATRNLLYSCFRKGIELSEMSPQHFAAAVMKKRSTSTDSRVGFSFLYNPVGEIVAAVGSADPEPYIEKGHNLEGVRRLASLKTLSILEGVPPERMPPFLDAHKRELGNPYTGAPMQWDPEKKRIFFHPPRGAKPVEIYL